MPREVLAFILEQISEADADLTAYPPAGSGWRSRAEATAHQLIPSLCRDATALKTYVEAVLNALIQLRQLWSEIRSQVGLPRRQIEQFDRQLMLDDVLGESVTGEVISKVVTKFLLEHNDDLRDNGRSDYPDLYRASADYADLPVFGRRRGSRV